MKIKVFFILGLISISTLIAQQNFINVPTGEVTLQRELFFQEQINFNSLTQSNSTLVYGIKNSWELGINILGLNFNNEDQYSFLFNDHNYIDPYNPLFAINGLKEIKIHNNQFVSIGSQIGLNIAKNSEFATMDYINYHIHNLLKEHSVFVLGSYYNSLHYGGSGNRVGIWTAFELPLSQKWRFMAESIVGSNAMCYTSFGVIYYLKKWLPFTLGYQIPNTGKNASSIVLEITITPNYLRDE